MVRFLRNATVAKIAGKDSSLLQISSEERERVARVADLFGEEDLTRHLQIMLADPWRTGIQAGTALSSRTRPAEDGHAQKLLPIEQLLSDVQLLLRPGSAITVKPAIVGWQQHPIHANRASDRNPRPNFVSPFAADSARKGTPRQEDLTLAPASGPRIVAQASQPEPVIMGSAAPALTRYLRHRRSRRKSKQCHRGRGGADRNLQLQSPRLQMPAESRYRSQAQTAVLAGLSDANQRILVSMLSSGEWSVQGNELVIKVSESQTVVDMSLAPEGKRIAIAVRQWSPRSRHVKLKVVPGATVAPQEKKNGGPRLAPGPGGRSRAEQDPVVRRMQEKFGAEIRTVIDYHR